jgi:hypothetical protein
MFPAGFLVYFVVQFGNAPELRCPPRDQGIRPLTVGLVLASGYVMSKLPITTGGLPAHRSLHGHLCLYQVNPLIVVAIAGFLGWLGLV